MPWAPRCPRPGPRPAVQGVELCPVYGLVAFLGCWRRQDTSSSETEDFVPPRRFTFPLVSFVAQGSTGALGGCLPLARVTL